MLNETILKYIIMFILLFAMLYNIYNMINVEAFDLTDTSEYNKKRDELVNLRVKNCNDLEKLNQLDQMKFNTPIINEKNNVFLNDFTSYLNDNTTIKYNILKYNKFENASSNIITDPKDLADFIGKYNIVPYQYVNLTSLFIDISMNKFIIYEEIEGNKLILYEYIVNEIAKDMDERFPPITIMITMTKYYVLNDDNLSLKQRSNIKLLNTLFNEHSKYLLNYNDGVYKLYNGNKHIIFNLEKQNSIK